MQVICISRGTLRGGKEIAQQLANKLGYACCSREQLMEAAHDLAREAGATSVELNVFAFNQSALRFYEQLGYGTVTFKMSKRL